VDVVAKIKRGEIGPLYFLYGEEAFLLEDALETIKRCALSPEAKDFNLDILNADETSAKKIIEIAETLPVFSERRLLIVKRFDAFPTNQEEALLPYLMKPCPTTCLVLIAEKIDQRKKLFQTLRARAGLIPCQSLKETQIPAWIKQRARDIKVSITEEAIAYLADRIGPDLTLLANELTKLSLLVEHGRPARIEDLRAVMGPQQMPSVFDLTRAIGKRDYSEALGLLQALLYGGEAPLKVLAMLIRQTRQMRSVKTLQVQGASPAEIAREVGISPYFLSEVLAEAKRYRQDEIESANRHLLAADSRLKRSRVNPQFILEDLILKLCRPGKEKEEALTGLL
jgi:DNA polymerase-3 subunit delta